MTNRDLIRLARLKVKEEKARLREAEKAAKEAAKEAERAARKAAREERNNFKDHEKKSIEEQKAREKALVERADAILFGLIKEEKATKDGDYITYLDDGNVVGIHDGEIFYTMQEDRKSYLVLTKPNKTIVDDGDHYPSYAHSTYFQSERVLITRSGAKNPQTDYSNCYSFDFFDSKRSAYTKLHDDILLHLPKDFYDGLFDYKDKSKSNTQ